MRTYDTYKDSGISWLGQIPSHWDVRRTKTIWEEHVSLSETGTEQLLSVSQYDGVKPNDEGSRSESLVGYKVVDSSNLVINIMLAWLGGLGVSQYKGIVSPAYCVYKLKENHCPEYFHYLYRTAMYLAEFARKSTGVVPSRWRMYTDSFGTVLSLVPPLAEQEAIVAYLDSATAEIDKAIASQQRMVELLQERKQIIINQAVTQGLNPDAPMKPTNIDRIKRVPKHWDVCAFKRNIKINNGRDYKDYIDEKVYPVIGSGGCFVYCSRYLYDGEALLLGRKGTINKPMYINGKFWTVDTMFYAIPSKQLNCKFAYFMALTFPFEYYSTQTALPSMTQSDLGSIKVALPPYSEQIEIVNYIESSIKPVDEAISRCEQKIALLTERKQILINDVVTGKIKVL